MPVRAHALSVGLMVLGILACAQKGVQEPGRESLTNVSTEPLKLLSDETLREVVAEHGSVALTRIEKVMGSEAGTRSAQVALEIRVLQVLRGKLPSRFSLKRWSREAASPVQKGRMYMMATTDHELGGGGFSLATLEFAEVPSGREADAVRAHLDRLAEVENGPKGE